MRRALRCSLVALICLAAGGCATSAVWSPGASSPGVEAHGPGEVAIEATGIQRLELEGERRLRVQVLLSDGSLQDFELGVAGTPPADEPDPLLATLPRGDLARRVLVPTERSGPVLRIGTLAVELVDEPRGRLLQVCRSGAIVAERQLPTTWREETNPALILAILATPLTVALDLSTLPLQVVFLLVIH
ncbi:MAG: hypothetical protein AB7N76_31715 [Planctomycetota bacterium]